MALAVIWVLTAVWIKVNKYKTDQKPDDSIIFYLMNSAQLASTGIILISILQIYNWFSDRSICTMMSIYISAELLGYLTPTPVSQIQGSDVTNPIYYFTFAGVYLILAFVDCFAFQYMPSKLGIYIDQR